MDKNTLKVLLYINKCDGRVPYSSFDSKFSLLKNPTLDVIKSWLFTNHFAYLDYADVDEYGNLINPQAIVLTIQGKQELDKHLRLRRGDLFARIMAIIALIISLVNLWLNLSSA